MPEAGGVTCSTWAAEGQHCNLRYRLPRWAVAVVPAQQYNWGHDRQFS